MQIVGCDLHTRQQTVAFLDQRTGKLVRRVLYYDGGTLRDFYNNLRRPPLVGIEATGSIWRRQITRGRPARLGSNEPRTSGARNLQALSRRDSRGFYLDH